MLLSRFAAEISACTQTAANFVSSVPRILRVSSVTVKTFAVCWKKSAVSCIMLPGTSPSTSLAEQLALRAGGRFEAELAVGVCSGDAALRCALDIAFHNQIRLVYFLNRAGFFAYCDRQRIQTNGTAVEFVDQCFDDALVPLIEPVAIDLQHGEGAICEFRGDFSFGFHLHVIAHPTQQIVCRPWGPA